VLDGPQEAKPNMRYLVGCDLGFTNDRSVVVVAHAEPNGPEAGAPRRVHVDNLKVWRGTRLRPVQLAEVEEWITTVSTLYNRAEVHCDPSEARGMLQRLSARGIRAQAFLFTTQSVGRLGQALHLALKNGLLWIPKDEALLEELARVRLIPTGIGQARLDHDSGKHDDMAVSIGIVTALLLEGSYGSGAKQWLESLAPMGPCGHPSLKGSTACQKCGIPLSPVVEEAAPEPERSAEPFSPFSWSTPNRAPDPTTVAVLQQLQEAGRSGWTRTF
jgi:hypothetical protein